MKDFHVARHSWANKIIPPLIVLVVAGSIWYVFQGRPAVPLGAAPSDTHASSASATAKASSTPRPQVTGAEQTATPISPLVQKMQNHLEFSVNPAPLKKVQKVEFYVEQQFVGAAYSQPYKVTVNETDISAGSHTVVAKIYSDSGTTQSQPVSFSSSVNTTPTPIETATPPPAAPPVNTPVNTELASPTNVAATAAIDGTSATLNWDAVTGADSYQIWRDGAQVATATGTGYSDTGLQPGQTYDYSVRAVSSTSTSDPSTMVAVTMPDPHVLGDSTDEPAQAIQPPPQSPDITPN